MSDRRKKAGAKNRMVAIIAAVVVHVVILGVILVNFTFKEDVEEIKAFDADKIDVVKASVIDDRKLEEQKQKIKDQERKKREQERRERERLEKLKKDAAKEKKRLDDLKKKQKEEAKKAAELEKQRKAIALKKKKEEEERLRKERERKERERIEKEEAEYRERQRLQQMLEEEERIRKQEEAERRAAERVTTVVGKFFADIRRRIEFKRNISPSFESWRKSVVDIKVSPSGEVITVRTIESSGLAAYDKSVEDAVWAASPVPMPDSNQHPDAVQRLLNFELEFKHPNAIQ